MVAGVRVAAVQEWFTGKQFQNRTNSAPGKNGCICSSCSSAISHRVMNDTFGGLLLIGEVSLDYHPKLTGATHLTLKPKSAASYEAIHRERARILAHGKEDRRMVLLTSKHDALFDDLVALRAPGLKLAWYTPLSLEPPRTGKRQGLLCWYGGRCLNRTVYSLIDRVFVYTQDAFRIFPRVVPKLVWLPVSWGGTGALPPPQTRSDMQRLWDSGGSIGRCDYILSTGYHGRDWSGLLDATANLISTMSSTVSRRIPPLRLSGVTCHNPARSFLCRNAERQCASLGKERCQLVRSKLSRDDYIGLLQRACIIVLPVDTEFMHGPGLTGVSEALSMGKVTVATDKLGALNRKECISQWDGYLENQTTGLILPSNTMREWRAVLESYATQPSRWLQLEAGARAHALRHFSLEGVSEQLWRQPTDHPRCGSASLQSTD